MNGRMTKGIANKLLRGIGNHFICCNGDPDINNTRMKVRNRQTLSKKKWMTIVQIFIQGKITKIANNQGKQST